MLKKIALKLIVAVSLSIIVIIGVFAYLNVQSQSKALLDELQRHVIQQSETVKSSTRFGMLLNERNHVHNIINTIGEQSCVEEVRVFNKNGEVIYSSDSSHIGMMVDKKAEACYNCHASDKPLERLSITERTRIFEGADERIMGTINPIYNEPSCYLADCHAHSADQTVLGVLDITVGLSATDQEIAGAKLKMIIFALIAIAAISAVLLYFMRIWIDKPVHKLVEATQTVASGDLNYVINIHTEDELGTLARSFNNMTKKLAEARFQLFQADKMSSLGRLAAGVAHEINNPLTGILTYSSYLLKRTKDNKEIQSDLEVIVNETKRSREIVKGLLDFARQSVPKKNKADINAIINKAVAVIDNQIKAAEIDLIREFDENLPQVVVDANQLEQVFINLIVNAIQASEEEGSKITVSTSLMTMDPYGVYQVKNAVCPKGHSLMDQTVKINGMPTIRVKVRTEGKSGFVNLDPVYGLNRNNFGIKIDADSKYDLTCPKCDTSLLDKTKKCPKCGGAVYFYEIPGKGRFEGCAQSGGEWQSWPEIDKEGKKKFIVIKVTDEGCGIPQENLSKIFEPFFTTKGQRGTGLGLAVIWGIIDKHDGRITVDSKQGQGSTFTIRLPVEKDTESY